MIRWLRTDDRPDAFPPVTTALAEPDGLLAAGGDLSPERLLAAYRRGIFPWYEEGQPILWWSPDPRCVLLPDALKVSRSLSRRLRRGDYEITFDSAFDEVIRACAEPRQGSGGTWITDAMIDAYVRLHTRGWAHSVEVWRQGRLVGGLYGVAIGRVFFGESMFSRATDASKVALVSLVSALLPLGYRMLDCQLPSAHLESLGAAAMPRPMFIDLLQQFCGDAVLPPPWPANETPPTQTGTGTDRNDGSLPLADPS
jgi:leucyl/phenylalanyl-tRNA---protein transferase